MDEKQSLLTNPEKKETKTQPKSFSGLTGYAYTINYILGVGVLGIPYAFSQAGVLISSIFLLIVSIFSAFTMMFLIETEARAEGIISFKEKQNLEKEKELTETDSEDDQSDSLENNQQKDQSPHQSNKEDDHKKDSISSDVNLNSQNQNNQNQKSSNSKNSDQNSSLNKTSNGNNSNSNLNENDVGISNISSDHEQIDEKMNDPSIFTIKDRKFEINELSQIFLGKHGKRFWTIAVLCYEYGALWSYAAVFASSLTSLFPLHFLTHGGSCDVDGDFSSGCKHTYQFYMAIYFLIMVPMSCRDLTEQKIVQLALCIFRFFSLFLIILTTIISMYTTKQDSTIGSNPPYIGSKKLFDVHGLGTIFTTAVFAQIVHHSSTIIAEPIKNKYNLRKVYNFAFLSTFSFYTLVGVICAVYFGSKTKSVITLNWIHLKYLTSSPWFYEIIKYFIVMFPVLDVLSAFPLNAITLSNNMYYALFPVQKQEETNQQINTSQAEMMSETEPILVPSSPDQNESNEVKIEIEKEEVPIIEKEEIKIVSITSKMEEKKIKKRKILFRLLASIPPIIGALFVRSLPDIILVNGLFGCFISYIIPALLQYRSIKIANNVFGHHKTPYTSFFSGKISIISSGIFGLIALVGTFVITIINMAK